MGKKLEYGLEAVYNSYSYKIDKDLNGNDIYIGCFGSEGMEFCRSFRDVSKYNGRVLIVRYDSFVSKAYSIDDDIDEFNILARGFLKKLLMGGYI
jgi:hypothetical protein